MKNIPPQLRVLSRNRAISEESGATGCLFQPKREMEKDMCWQGGDKNLKKKKKSRTSLAVHWLRHHTSTAGGTGSIPGLGIKIPHATWL